MAFTYRRPGSSKIWIGFRLPDGRQRQMSSGLEDEAQALQLAISYERAAAAAKQGRLLEAQARRVIREIQTIAGLEPLAVESAGAFLDRRLAALKARFRQGRTLERYTDALERWRRGNPELAAGPLHEVGKRHAAAWRDQLTADGLAASTVNHHLTTLTREWKEAKLQEIIAENPWEGIRVPRARATAQRRRAFTWAQFTALLQTTRADDPAPIPDAAEWHLFLKIAGYMGQRRMDVARLQADQIDIKRRVVRFHRAKTRDWLEVPVHPALWPDLQAALKRHPRGHLMPALASRPVTGRASLSDEFRQVILPRIGIDQPYGKRGEGRRLADYSIHSLRHALSTWLNEAGVSDVDRMRIVGHADRDVSLGYTHAGLKEARRAIGRLPRLRLDRPARGQ